MRNAVDCAYIDFSKAFDSVSHSKLCIKLAAYGFEGKLLTWISSFLSDRTQAVRVGKCSSKPRQVISGVPQGSVIGPLLFLLYINDIANMFGNGISVKLFADDVKIYVTVNNIEDSLVLQSGLNALFDWSVKWQLNVSANKCLILQLGSSNKHFVYNINNSVLPNVLEARDLGILVDSDLKFNRHICYIATKAHQRASLILRCFKSRDTNMLFKAFITYVRPLLEYNCQIWSPCYVSLVAKIESVQRKFTKRLKGFNKLSYPDRLSRLGAESLQLRRLKLDLVLFYNILHGFVDVDTYSLINLIDTDIVHSRGHSLRIVKQHCRLNCRSNSFACRNINAWNSLPDYAVTCKSVVTFKRQISLIDFSKFLIVI
jgi:hypothetical protein